MVGGVVQTRSHGESCLPLERKRSIGYTNSGAAQSPRGSSRRHDHRHGTRARHARRRRVRRLGHERLVQRRREHRRRRTARSTPSKARTVTLTVATSSDTKCVERHGSAHGAPGRVCREVQLDVQLPGRCGRRRSDRHCGSEQELQREPAEVHRQGRHDAGLVRARQHWPGRDADRLAGRERRRVAQQRRHDHLVGDGRRLRRRERPHARDRHASPPTRPARRRPRPRPTALGNTGTGSVPVKLDKTKPTIAGSGSPAANAFGWNNSNVTVSLTCSDALSGIKTCTGGGSVVLGNEGANQSVSGSATDNADNSASRLRRPVQHRQDRAEPQRCSDELAERRRLVQRRRHDPLVGDRRALRNQPGDRPR